MFSTALCTLMLKTRYSASIKFKASVAILSTANKFGRPPTKLRAASTPKILCATMAHPQGLMQW
jgi:hypothetical protein